jgi:hypothetical protein
VRRFTRIVVWTVVFAACAAVGAVFAANTNPFPPGVDDPGVRSTDAAAPTTSSVAPLADTWLVRIDTRTYHDLFVGGRCAANWRIDISIAAVDGPIEGAGSATLKGELRCDEPTAQVQAERVDLEAVGSARDGELRFRLEATRRSPAGSQELSGFLETIPAGRLVIAARDGATASFDRVIPDGGQGTYGAAGSVVLTAIAG